MNVNDVVKKIAPFLKESGFTKRGKSFFKLKGLCLFVVSFEAGNNVYKQELPPWKLYSPIYHN